MLLIPKRANFPSGCGLDFALIKGARSDTLAVSTFAVGNDIFSDQKLKCQKSRPCTQAGCRFRMTPADLKLKNHPAEDCKPRES